MVRKPTRCDFLVGWGPNDYLTSTTEIVVPSDALSVALTFATLSDAEQSDEWDLRKPQVSIDGGAFQTLPLIYDSPWRTARYDLSFAIGHTLRLRFHFDAVDNWDNEYIGWMIDDIRVETGAQPATPFCVGDGTGPACPCGNVGASGHGCATSFNTAGALLMSAGVASVGSDTLSITASGVSNASATLFQGPASESFLPGTANGDGVMCLMGSLVRIQSSLAQAGVAAYPGGGVPISVRGALPPAGATRFYQVRYRNAASYCTPATYNFTNGLIVTWTP